MRWQILGRGLLCSAEALHTSAGLRGRMAVKSGLYSSFSLFVWVQVPKDGAPYFCSSHRHYLPTKPRGNHFS